jgi:hypothetical protein
MPVIVYRQPEWKAVPAARRLPGKCPRCRNQVEFELVYDTETIMWFVPVRRVYALRCPVCIHWERAGWKIRKELL